MKATDTVTGEMVAMCMWQIPVQLEPQYFEDPDKLAGAEDNIERQASEDGEARTRAFWKTAESIKKKFSREFLGTRPHACQSSLRRLRINTDLG